MDGKEGWIAAVLMGILLILAGWSIGPSTTSVAVEISLICLLCASWRLYQARLDAGQWHMQEIADLQRRAIEALEVAMETKDRTTHEHLCRVQVYAAEIGKALCLSPPELKALEAAAMLHDIGKLAVPEYIISKPGKLSPAEFARMKIHPLVGAEILERLALPFPLVPIVRSHHEQWDGNGYPHGLKGADIPIGARILSVVDCFDALASDRQYRRAFPLWEALEMVRVRSGTAFDPDVVSVLATRYLELESLARAVPTPQKALSQPGVSHTATPPGAGYEEEASADAIQDGTGLARATSGGLRKFDLLVDILNDWEELTNLHECLSRLMARLRHLVPHRAMAIYLARSGKLVMTHLCTENSVRFHSSDIPFGEGVSGWVAEHRRPIMNANAGVEPGKWTESGKPVLMRSALAVPLDGSMSVAGVLTLYHSLENAFQREDLRVLLAISSRIGLAIEKAAELSELESSAVTDDITGLANARSLFLALDNELIRSKRSGSPLAVLVMDFQGFTRLREEFGQYACNQTLQVLARALRDSCRPYDLVARMSEEEFVMIVPGSRPGAGVAKAPVLREILREAGLSVSREDLLSLTVGEASFPNDGDRSEQLLAAAQSRKFLLRPAHSPDEPAPSLAGFDLKTATIH